MLNQRNTKSKQKGFTLIELMVVVIIVAVLMAIALPAYNNQVIRTNRSAAQTEMLNIANMQQQYLLSNRAYMSGTLLAATGFVLDPDVSKHYSYGIALGMGTVPSYVLTFTPGSSAQSGDGDMTLNEQGVGTPPDKWKR
jgi:type IV pilus assembly protein PilE